MTWPLVPILLLLPSQLPNLRPALLAAAERSDLAKTQARLEKEARQDPNNAHTWVQLAQVYAQRKKPEQALAAAGKAEALGADDPGVLRDLVSLFIELQPDLKKAAALQARYAGKVPGDRTAWRRAAALYLEAGLPEQAVQAGNRGLAGDSSPEMRTILGQAYTALQDWDNAATQLTAALRSGSPQEDAHFRLARMYMLQHDYPHAVEVLLNARQIFGKSLPIELALGVCYYGQRRYADAVDQFLQAIRMAPDAPQAYVLLGNMLDHAGDRLPEVKQRFVDFNADNPSNALGYLLHAKVLLALPAEAQSTEADQALALLRRALALKPDLSEAHCLIGQALERKRQFKAAVDELEQCIAANPQASAPHSILAEVYEQLGRAEDAARERELFRKLSAAEQAAPDKVLGLDSPAPTGLAHRHP